MKKVLKTIKILFIILSILIPVYNVCKSDHILKGLINLTDIGPAIYTLYLESDFIYFSVNKIKGYLLNKTNSFEITFYLKKVTDNFVQQIDESLNETLKELKWRPTNGANTKYNGIFLKSNIITNSNIEATITISDDNMDKIGVSLKFQVSNRDIPNIWNKAKSFRECFLRSIPSNDGRVDIYIDMSSSKTNPFYRLTLRDIEVKNIDCFHLNFNESETFRIELTKHGIYATSKEIGDLDRVIKEYIPLVNVG